MDNISRSIQSGAGGEVNHPEWVLDALKSKPVVIYAHKGCDYCTPQTEAMTKIDNEIGDKFTYFNLSADGSDARSEEALRAYDPNGGSHVCATDRHRDSGTQL